MTRAHSHDKDIVVHFHYVVVVVVIVFHVVFMLYSQAYSLDTLLSAFERLRGYKLMEMCEKLIACTGSVE